MSRKRIGKSLVVVSALMFGSLLTSTLTGCFDLPIHKIDGDEEEPSNPVVGVTITNKEELTAEWHVGEADRTISIQLSPSTVGVTSEILSGRCVITSSNTDVITVSSRVVTAVGAGEATITVADNGYSDSVTITVLDQQTADKLYGTVHKGTEEDPLDNEDAITVAEAVGKGNTTDIGFYIKGTIESWHGADTPGNSYGNVSFDLKPAEGKTRSFVVYRVKFEDKDVTEENVWLGGEALVFGKITLYGSTAETASGSGTLISCTGEKIEAQTIEATVAEAIAFLKEYGDNKASIDTYIITGYIVAKDSECFYISDTKGEVSEIDKDTLFGVYKYTGENKDRCSIGAKVKVTATIMHYVSSTTEGKHTYETSDLKSVEILEDGEVVNTIEATLAEAVEIATNLADKDITKDKYAVEGYIESIAYPYSAGNMSFWLSDTVGGEKQLEAFKCYPDASLVSKLIVGAKVKVTGFLTKYGDTLEFAEGNTVELLEESTVVIEEHEVNVTEALAVIDALEDNGETTTDLYIVTGYISKIQYPWSADKGVTFFMSDEKGATNGTFQVYGLRCSETEKVDYVVGAKVEIKATLKKYVKDSVVTPETGSIKSWKVIEKAEGGDTSTEDVTSIKDIAENNNVDLKVKVVALANNGFVVDDGTAGVYVRTSGYTGENKTPSIGDILNIKGTVSAYQSALQINPTAITKLEGETVTVTTGTAITTEKIASSYAAAGAGNLSKEGLYTISNVECTTAGNFPIFEAGDIDLEGTNVLGSAYKPVVNSHYDLSFYIAGKYNSYLTIQLVTMTKVEDGEGGGGTPIDPIDPTDGTPTTITISPTDFTAVTSAEINQLFDDVNINVTSGTVNSDQVRVFKGQTITFSSTYVITELEFTCTANNTTQYGPGCFAAVSGYTYSDKIGTWSGALKSISFKADSNQVRMTQIKVTYLVK